MNRLREGLVLNEYLVTHKEATFFAMVKGDSMRNAGINDGDLLVVDRSLEPAHCDTLWWLSLMLS